VYYTFDPQSIKIILRALATILRNFAALRTATFTQRRF